MKSMKPHGYQGARDDAGLTPRQRLDSLKADLAQIEIDQKNKDLVSKSEVIAAAKECAEVIQSDLYGTLVSKLVSALSNRKTSPGRCREVCTGIVDEIVKSWEHSNIVNGPE